MLAGERGYRSAQLEAGIVSGRLQLAAFALGRGGSGMSFIDDVTEQVVGISDAIMLATVIGTADYPGTAGGPPGQPRKLSRLRRPRD